MSRLDEADSDETTLLLQFRACRADDAAAVAALFEETNVPCFCQYFQFNGDARQWLDRCANDQSRSRAQLLEEIQTGSALAAVACHREQLVGWARVMRSGQMQKLYEGRLYKNLPVLTEGERRDVFAVACFLVEPSWRRRGAARGLLQCLLKLAADQGASALEAFPRGASDVSDGEQWMGPLAIFEELGFSRVSDFAPYPVYRYIF